MFCILDRNIDGKYQSCFGKQKQNHEATIHKDKKSSKKNHILENGDSLKT